MDITVKRLHELKGRQLGDFGALVLAEIQPQTTNIGTTWVCQRLQQPHFWGADFFKRMVDRDGDEASPFMVWVGLDRKPLGLCWITTEKEDRKIDLYLVDTSHTEPEQWAIADAIAIRSLTEMLAQKHPNRELWGLFPKLGWAARYATRCGFRSRILGKPMAPDPNPILEWRIGVKELLDNIQGLQ